MNWKFEQGKYHQGRSIRETTAVYKCACEGRRVLNKELGCVDVCVERMDKCVGKKRTRKNRGKCACVSKEMKGLALDEKEG